MTTNDQPTAREPAPEPADDDELARIEAAIAAVKGRVDIHTARPGDGSPGDYYQDAGSILAEINDGDLPAMGRTAVIASANQNFEWRHDLGRLMAMLLRDAECLIQRVRDAERRAQQLTVAMRAIEGCREGYMDDERCAAMRRIAREALSNGGNSDE